MDVVLFGGDDVGVVGSGSSHVGQKEPVGG